MCIKTALLTLLFDFPFITPPGDGLPQVLQLPSPAVVVGFKVSHPGCSSQLRVLGFKPSTTQVQDAKACLGLEESHPTPFWMLEHLPPHVLRISVQLEHSYAGHFPILVEPDSGMR